MIACPKCRTIQPIEQVNTGRLSPCPACAVSLRIDVYNAFLHTDDEGRLAEVVFNLGQAECYYHPGKAAEVPCSSCGRLLCPVCRVDLDSRILCMNCLQSGRDKQKITELQNKHPLYDSIAMMLSFFGGLMIFSIPLTAPAAIYFCVRHWRTPSPILPKRHIRNILALLMACGQVVFMVFLLIAIVAAL
jgi:hypothetical protein